MRILATAKDVETGFDIAYGFDAFIHNPLVLSGSAGVGAVGQAWVTDLRATLGLVFAGIEAYAGAERIAIGNEVLAGPVVGVRVWF